MGYAIDNIDLKDGFGIVVSAGKASLLELPNPKPVYEYDWGDENGVDVDIDSEPVFQPRNISLQVWFLSESEQEFWANYRAFLAVLRSRGLRRLYSSELNRSFYVRYQGATGTTSPTRIKSGKIGVSMTLNFQEPNPSFFAQFALLTDEAGRIITLGGIRINIGDPYG